MIVGPVFGREVAIAPRRPRFHIYRALYAVALLLLMCTAWLILAGAQIVRSVGDMARFGAALFQILAALQLSLILFLSAMGAASSVAQEKDRRTLVLLLMTRINNVEVVLGKLMASLLQVAVMLAAGLPVFALATLFGGVSFEQLGRAFAVTFATVFGSGTLGTTVAFWRDKTFQTLAMTALALVIWLGACEVLAAGLVGSRVGTIPSETLAAGLSPIRAILDATRSEVAEEPALGPLRTSTNLFLVNMVALAAILNTVAIMRVRVWNPSREIRRYGPEGPAAMGEEEGATQPEQARARHVDARGGHATDAEPSREVWDNPILWREMRTRAYGRKIVAIRLVYLALFTVVALVLYRLVNPGDTLVGAGQFHSLVPSAAIPLALFFWVSLLIVNALAVTSITTERDGRCLDLLLATEISPAEFVFGKLGGVFWVTKEMVLCPMGLAVGLWWAGGLHLEGLLYVLVGLLVMDVFVATLGLHCGVAYANSRTAISVSLGIVFFLFLGVATCIAMLISFSGSFEAQLAPFFFFILGGGVGLYVSLGVRNPSPAIAGASLVVPFFTFYAVVSFLVDHAGIAFLLTIAAYGFSVAAMLIPALHEFDFAMGRTTAGDD